MNGTLGDLVRSLHQESGSDHVLPNNPDRPNRSRSRSSSWRPRPSRQSTLRRPRGRASGSDGDSENEQPITTNATPTSTTSDGPPPLHADTGKKWFSTSGDAKLRKHPRAEKHLVLPRTMQDVLPGGRHSGSEEEIPRLQQDLNQPFIPSSSARPPNVFGQLWTKLTSMDMTATSGRGPGSTPSEGGMHSVAALIATTGNLVGVSSPTVATVGPAWSYGDGAEVMPGTGGMRRVARYTRKEAVPDELAQDRTRGEFERTHRRRKRKTSKERKDQNGDDEMLDEIAEEGTENICQTEGATNPAYPADYNVGEEDTVVPSGEVSSVDERSDDSAPDPNPDLEKGARKRRSHRRKGNYAGWVGSKRGERVQQEIFMFVSLSFFV